MTRLTKLQTDHKLQALLAMETQIQHIEAKLNKIIELLTKPAPALPEPESTVPPKARAKAKKAKPTKPQGLLRSGSSTQARILDRINLKWNQTKLPTEYRELSRMFGRAGREALYGILNSLISEEKIILIAKLTGTALYLPGHARTELTPELLKQFSIMGLSQSQVTKHREAFANSQGNWLEAKLEETATAEDPPNSNPNQEFVNSLRSLADEMEQTKK